MADITADPRESYGRLFHEQGRLTVNAEREKPFGVEPWEDRSSEQREIDMRGASAVAAQAVHDAGLRSEAEAMELARYRTHRNAACAALRAQETAFRFQGDDVTADRYRAARVALEGSEEDGRDR